MSRFDYEELAGIIIMGGLFVLLPLCCIGGYWISEEYALRKLEIEHRCEVGR